MRKSLLPLGLVVVLVAAFAFSRGGESDVDFSNYMLTSDPVTLDFRIHKVSSEGVELKLMGKRMPTIFMQFGVSGDVLNPVLTLEGLTRNSRLKATASERHWPDFPFLRDEAGNPLRYLSFENQLGGDLYSSQEVLLMKYVGPPVPLIQQLVISQPVTIPSFVSMMFGVEGQLQFQPANLQLDPRLQGFWIPVEIVGWEDEL